MAKKLKISVEKSERIVVRQTKSQNLFCDFCLQKTAVLSLQQTALTLNVSERQAAKLLEDGAFHFTESIEGLLLICQNSLEDRENW